MTLAHQAAKPDAPAAVPLDEDTAPEAFRSFFAQTEPEAKDGDAPGETTQSQPEPEASAEGEASEPAKESDDTAKDTESEVSEEPLYTVKIDGKEERVTLKEALQGYQRQKDYQRKTAEAAEQRRQAEAALQAASTERQQYQQQLQSFIPLLAGEFQSKFANVDWTKLAQDNPAEYVAKRAEHDTMAARIQAALQQQQALHQQAAQEQQRQYRNYLAEQYSKLTNELPEFGDPQKRDTARNELRAFLRDRGFEDNEINAIADHRAILLARDAMLYRKAQAAAKAAAKDANKAPKVVKPGTQNVGAQGQKAADLQASLERLKKSGHMDDAREAMRHIL